MQQLMVPRLQPGLPVAEGAVTDERGSVAVVERLRHLLVKTYLWC